MADRAAIFSGGQDGLHPDEHGPSSHQMTWRCGLSNPRVSCGARTMPTSRLPIPYFRSRKTTKRTSSQADVSTSWSSSTPRVGSREQTSNPSPRTFCASSSPPHVGVRPNAGVTVSRARGIRIQAGAVATTDYVVDDDLHQPPTDPEAARLGCQETGCSPTPARSGRTHARGHRPR